MNLPQINQQKGPECVHKIRQFQAHKGCQKLASICTKECQQLHGEVMVMSVDAVEDHFQAIRQLIIKEVRKFSESLKKQYNEMIYELQRQEAENTKQMEKQLLSELVKNIALEKGVVEKIENKRYQRIKCHELMTFMEQSNVEQKIKKSAHSTLYYKYENNVTKFKDLFFKYSTQIIESKHPNSAPQNSNVKGNKNQPQNINSKSDVKVNSSPQQEKMVNQVSKKDQSSQKSMQLKNLQNKLKSAQEKYQNMLKSQKQIVNEHQKKTHEYNCLIVEKKNLQRELDKYKSKRVPKLRSRTWNIFKLSTKKIRKQKPLIDIESEKDDKPEIVIQPELSSQKKVISLPQNKILVSSLVSSEQRQVFQPSRQMNENPVEPQEKIAPIHLEATKPMNEMPQLFSSRNQNQSVSQQENKDVIIPQEQIPEEEQNIQENVQNEMDIQGQQNPPIEVNFVSKANENNNNSQESNKNSQNNEDLSEINLISEANSNNVNQNEIQTPKLNLNEQKQNNFESYGEFPFSKNEKDTKSADKRNMTDKEKEDRKGSSWLSSIFGKK